MDGETRPDRLNAAEPTLPPGLGEPPAWLDHHGREAWARLDEKLRALGIASRADSEAATIYCRNYSTWRECLLIVEDESFAIKGKTTYKPHPLLPLIKESQRIMLAILGQLGLTPSGRAGLHVQAPAASDALLAFVKRRSGGADADRKG